MRRITLHSDDGTGFEPRCFHALANYSGPLFDQQHLPHPSGIVSHAWNEVIGSFDRTFDALDAMGKATQSNDALTENLLTGFKDILYRSTEFFDSLSVNVAAALTPNDKKKLSIGGPQALRGIVALPCNRLKHNHNRLDYFEAKSGVFRVPGFTIYHAVNGVLEANPEFHKKHPSKSYNLEVRKIFAAMYFYADTAADQISKLHPSTAPSKGVKINPRTIAVIKRLTTLPVFTFPYESSRDMPSIVYDGVTLTIAESGGLAFPVPRDAQMTARYRNDGATLTFRPPA